MLNNIAQTEEINIDLVFKQIETIKFEISELKPSEEPSVIHKDVSLESELDYESSIGNMRILFDKKYFYQALEDELSLLMFQGWKAYEEMEKQSEEESVLKRTYK